LPIFAIARAISKNDSEFKRDSKIVISFRESKSLVEAMVEAPWVEENIVEKGEVFVYDQVLEALKI